MNSVVIPTIEKLTEHGDLLAPVIGGVATAIGVFLVPATYEWAKANALAAASFIAANAPLIAIGATIAVVTAAIIYAVTHWDEITAAVDRFASSVYDRVLGAFDALGSGAKAAINEIIGAINGLISAWNGLQFGVSIPGAPDINVGTPDLPLIPRLARGGIVTRPTLALIGEAGPEAVVPLNRADSRLSASGETHIHVHVSEPLAPPEAIADAVARGLSQLTATGRLRGLLT